jgi:hypothetical protein
LIKTLLKINVNLKAVLFDEEGLYLQEFKKR